VGITAGSREVPGRKPVTRDNNNNNNNNNNNLSHRYILPRAMNGKTEASFLHYGKERL
jgi:hypothetical protein